ncbi:MAG: hypothetical protein AABZ06_02515 [Bdellovibrionota bacterium]
MWLNKFNNKSVKDGFTILEIVIVAGLTSILALAISQLIVMQQRSAKSILLSSDFNGIVSSIQLIINNESSCASVFSQFSFTPPTSGPLPRDISPAVKTSPLTIQGSTIATIGNSANGLNVTKLEINKLINDTLPDIDGQRQYMVNLHLEAAKSHPNIAIGNNAYSRDFQFTILVNTSNQITGCFGQMSSADICVRMGGIPQPSGTPPCKLVPYYQ